MITREFGQKILTVVLASIGSMKVALWSFAMLLALIPSQSFAEPDPLPPPPCQPCHCVGAGGGSLSYTNIAFSDNPVCVNTIVSAYAEDSVVGGRWRLYCENETTNCPPYYVTNWPSIVTNWYTISGPGGYFETGPGGGIGIIPTNCGDYTVVISGIWTNYNYCDSTKPGQGGSTSKNGTLRVINLEITPASSNAIINKCLTPDRKVDYCLTNSCYPGGVTWSLSPILTNGATLEGGGGCVSVKIGDAVADYTITATSKDNTNCTASASLSVSRDCVCANHLWPASFSPSTPEGGDWLCNTNDWSGSISNTPCGNTAQLICATCPGVGRCVTFYVNGQDVGHCHYEHSEWSAYYYLCKCGDLIKGSFWIITQNAPGIGPGVNYGYDISSDCGVLSAPHCFTPSGQTRQCGDHDW